MEEIPADIKAFLGDHPFLELTESRKVKCTLNGHELPLNLPALRNFTEGKKYQNLCKSASFNYSDFEPHVVPSTKQPNSLFCKLTLRHINRLPHHVLLHVKGKRYRRALCEYNECKQKGIEFVPASLRQKKRRESVKQGKSPSARQGDDVWAPSSSEDEGHESEDSMSDLYPSSMFTLKESTEAEKAEGGDDFQTASEDEEEASPMEVDKQMSQKRRKEQSLGFKKKLKSRNKKRKSVTC